jgi:hypothetical protein
MANNDRFPGFHIRTLSYTINIEIFFYTAEFSAVKNLLESIIDNIAAYYHYNNPPNRQTQTYHDTNV